MVEWLRNLELALHDIPVTCRHEFSPHKKPDEFGAARAESLRIKTGLQLLDRKVISQEEFTTNYLSAGGN